MLVPDLLRDAARQAANQRALVVDGIATLTYGEWDAASNRLARALVARGVQAGERVALWFANTDAHRFAIAYMAVQKAGAVNVPLNTRLTAGEVRALLDHSGASVMLHGREMPEGAPASCIGPDEQEASSCSSEPFQVHREADDLADILYTSGTTGTAKGVACGHGNIVAATASGGLAVFRGAAFLHAVPVFTFAGAHAMSLLPLRAGMTAVIQPRFDALRYLELVDEYRVAVAYCVPSMAQLMLDAGGPPRRSLRLLMYGTAPMPPTAIRRLPELFPNAMLINLYGLTEGGGAACALPPSEAQRRPTSVGKPVPPTELKIVGDEDVEATIGEIGEIWMRTPAQPRRYFRDDTATRSVWTEGGWLRTGDLGYVDADGYLYLVDRKKDLIIRGGFNIGAVEIENVLLEHPRVREAAVIGVPHRVLGEDTKAFVVAESVTADELEAFCRERLADYKVPRTFAFVAALPRNALGKVLKRELRNAP